MKFYIFNQNNTGGYWDKLLGFKVIVEAENPRQANKLAEVMGVYFDGVESGEDCECCGDRWCEVDEDDAVEPENLAKELEDIKRRQKDWELSSAIRYADGRVEEII